MKKGKICVIVTADYSFHLRFPSEFSKLKTEKFTPSRRPSLPPLHVTFFTYVHSEGKKQRLKVKYSSCVQ